MIQKLMKGNLGNQMFQYAVARALHEKFDKNGKLVLAYTEKYYNEKNHFTNKLNDFCLPEFVEFSDNIKLTDSQKEMIDSLEEKKRLLREKYGPEFEKEYIFYEKEMQPILNKNGICSMMNCYYPFDVKGDCVVLGYLETAKYFDDVKDLILKDFTPKYEPLKKNETLYSEIKNSNSICVSIRRGDFVENERIKQRHYVCTEQYFENAIKEMNKRVENPRYVFFSDDIEWVKENIKAPEGSLYEDGTDPVWEKIRLMYNCKHFILSNSTFSWWAQYLSRNDKKVVIAPSIWERVGYNPDIYQDNWVLIDVNKEREER